MFDVFHLSLMLIPLYIDVSDSCRTHIHQEQRGVCDARFRKRRCVPATHIFNKSTVERIQRVPGVVWGWDIQIGPKTLQTDLHFEGASRWSLSHR